MYTCCKTCNKLRRLTRFCTNQMFTSKNRKIKTRFSTYPRYLIPSPSNFYHSPPVSRKGKFPTFVMRQLKQRSISHLLKNISNYIWIVSEFSSWRWWFFLLSCELPWWRGILCYLEPIIRTIWWCRATKIWQYGLHARTSAMMKTMKSIFEQLKS